MRPQQQNRRMRGRGNNPGGGGGNNNNSNNNTNNQNRRGPNPLSRNYESNGPDVKIRGSAQQIADKYATLARDAHSSGDRVMAENYNQHAEHYNRIIAAAQAQNPVQVQHQQRDQRNEFDDDNYDEQDEQPQGQFGGPSHVPQQQPEQQQPEQPQQRSPQVFDGSGPQPEIEGLPVEVALEQGGINGVNGHRPGIANGEAVASDGEGDGQPRRSRRPRRSRNRGERSGENEAGGEQGASGDDAGDQPKQAEPAGAANDAE